MRRLIVEEIPWVYACCDRLIRAEDIASASRFQNERRRTEHLAWRRIVRRELGESVAIGYNDVGAPVVDTPNTYISVAHGAGCVVVAISDRGIGVDVESAERDFSRAASRYMNKGERALSSEENWAAKVWTAKEALYKLYGERGVELKEGFRITSYDKTTQQLSATLANGEQAMVDIATYKEGVIVATAYFTN